MNTIGGGSTSDVVPEEFEQESGKESLEEQRSSESLSSEELVHSGSAIRNTSSSSHQVEQGNDDPYPQRNNGGVIIPTDGGVMIIPRAEGNIIFRNIRRLLRGEDNIRRFLLDIVSFLCCALLAMIWQLYWQG